MKCQFQSLDVVVRRVLVDLPHGFSPPMGQQAHIDPPVSEPDMDVEGAPMVPDAQSAPNTVVEMLARLMLLWQILLMRSL